LFTVLISLASCLVEMTILVKTILLTTLLLENGSAHLLDIVTNDYGASFILLQDAND